MKIPKLRISSRTLGDYGLACCLGVLLGFCVKGGLRGQFLWIALIVFAFYVGILIGRRLKAGREDAMAVPTRAAISRPRKTALRDREREETKRSSISQPEQTQQPPSLQNSQVDDSLEQLALFSPHKRIEQPKEASGEGDL